MYKSSIEDIYYNYIKSTGNLLENKEALELLQQINEIINQTDIASMQQLFDCSISYAYEIGKSSFIKGFKMAVQIMHECNI